MRYMSVEILSTAAQQNENHIWKGLQWVNDLEIHSRSSEFPLFDIPYITSYQWSVVTTLSCSVFKILPQLLHVTVRSPSAALKLPLKLQAACAFGFMYKYIAVNTWYISDIWKIEKFHTPKCMNFEVTQGPWSIVRRWLRDHTFSCFSRILTCIKQTNKQTDRQTDGQTQGKSIYRASIAWRGKKRRRSMETEEIAEKKQNCSDRIAEMEAAAVFRERGEERHRTIFLDLYIRRSEDSASQITLFVHL